MAENKSMLTAYLWWIVLGLFGAHRFYMGKTKSAILLMCFSLFWMISLFVKKEPFGIVALVNALEPLEKFLLEFGQIGRIGSGLIFVSILTFPGLWWISDSFRIPRWIKTQERPPE